MVIIAGITKRKCDLNALRTVNDLTLYLLVHPKRVYMQEIDLSLE